MLFCDEKTQIQALDRTQPGLPLKRGRCPRKSYVDMIVIAAAVTIKMGSPRAYVEVARPTAA